MVVVSLGWVVQVRHQATEADGFGRHEILQDEDDFWKKNIL